MDKKYILSIDCGTQSIRAMIFDSFGNLVGKEKKEFEKPYFSVKAGYAEQNVNIYWEYLCDVCQEVKRKYEKEFNQIEGVVTTTLRDTFINIDENGEALRPSILWLDQRMAKCEEKLSIKDRAMFYTVGMLDSIEVVRKKSKANWIKENEPEIWDKTYKYIMISAYFTLKLTGEIKDSIANQVGHIPFDYKNKRWPKSDSDYRWSVFGVEKEKLVELVKPCTVLGHITKEAAEQTGIREGLPLIASASDKACETLGSGCIDLSSCSISFGTTATIETTSKTYFEPLKFMPPYTSAIPDYYNPEVEIFRGYWMISWFKHELAAKEVRDALERGVSPEDLLNERLMEVPPGSQGLMLQPYWGPGLKNPEAKGAILGFSDVHTRIHIYRAIIEGINYALMDGLENIEKKGGTKVQKLFVSGGGAQSSMICQITADMFNIPVYRGETYETSGLGAAIIGFVALGIHDDFNAAIKNMVRYQNEFIPNEKAADIYRKLYERVYKKIYGNVKNIYLDIEKIIY